MRLIWIKCLVLAMATIALLPVAYPQEASSYWTLTADGQVFLVLELRHEKSGWSGQLSMPSKFDIGPGGKSFTHVSMPVQTEQLKDFGNPNNPLLFATDDGQRWELTISSSQDTAELKMLGFALDPWVLRRGGRQPVANDWSPSRTYSVYEMSASSDEMLRLYQLDQEDRTPNGCAPQRWMNLAKKDRSRRKQTRQLLDTGKLRTAEDFIRAAFVFQHGATKSDYLLAHTLALAALARGDKTAAWIAAATLDAYLQAVDQPQVFGTRFVIHNGKASPKRRFDPDLVPQQLREQVGVPSIQVGAQQFLKANK